MMSYFRRLHRNWETLAAKDPLWAICTDPSKKGGKWDAGDFFLSGRQEVNAVVACVKNLGLSIEDKGPLLDFGCGVGRLTQAFADHFHQCHGVDISAAMIENADRFNRFPGRCTYHVNVKPDLRLFADGYFGFIYSSLVLQHMKPSVSYRYLAEFGRLLRPGGIGVVQVIDNANLNIFRSIKNTLRLRTRFLKFVDRYVLRKPGEAAFVPMYCFPRKRLRALAARSGLRIVNEVFTNSADKDFNGNIRYAEIPPPEGYVSKQYVFLKI